MGLNPEKGKPNKVMRRCAECADEFIACRRFHRYCSEVCRIKRHNRLVTEAYHKAKGGNLSP